MDVNSSENIAEYFKAACEQRISQLGPSNQTALYRQFEEIKRSEMDAEGQGGDEEAIDSDTELVMAAQKRSTKCSLTQKTFVDPVRTDRCKHTFERAAIEQMIRTKRGGVVTCPIAGCSKKIELSDLKTDLAMVREVRKLNAASQR